MIFRSQRWSFQRRGWERISAKWRQRDFASVIRTFQNEIDSRFSTARKFNRNGSRTWGAKVESTTKTLILRCSGNLLLTGTWNYRFFWHSSIEPIRMRFLTLIGWFFSFGWYRSPVNKGCIPYCRWSSMK